MQQQTGIAEHLKLLADFVADVAVVGMQLFQLAVKGVNVFVLELRLAEATNDVQHVQRPATLRGFDFANGLKLVVTCANLGRLGRRTSSDDWNSGFRCDAAQVYVAAHPTGAARCRRKRLPLDDG